MAKDPAFLFYSQDFIVGVQTMTHEDRGKYITILCQMHQQGRLDEETIRFLVGSISDKLKAKFRIDERGLWFNERLELETARRNNFTESRRLNGNLGGRPKKVKPKGKPTQNHMHNHKANLMGNANEIVNENEIEDKIKSAFDSIYLDQEQIKWPHLDFKFEVATFLNKVRGSPGEYGNRDTNSLRLAFQYQLRNSKVKQNGSSKKKSTTVELATALAERMAKDAGLR